MSLNTTLGPEDAETPEEIVSDNLAKMKTDMMWLLANESMGRMSVEVFGQRFPCATANGVFDPKSGKILAFGNDLHETDDALRIGFTVAIGSGFHRIVQVSYNDENVSLGAKKVLLATIARWNDTYGGR